MTPRRRGKGASAVLVSVPSEGGTEDETEDKTEQQVAADETIEAAKQEAPKQAEAIIFRIGEKDGKERWLARVAASAISTEYLAENFGGGRYRIQFRKPNAAGIMSYGSQTTMEIDPSIPIKHPAALTAAVQGPGTKGEAPSDRISQIFEAGLLNLFQTQAQSSQAMMSAMQAIVASAGANKGPDIATIITALSPIVTALLTRTGSQKDPLEVMAGLTEILSRGNAKPAESLKDQLETFALIKETFGGGEGGPGGDPTLNMVTQLGSKTLDLMREAQAQQATVGKGVAPRRALVNPPVAPQQGVIAAAPAVAETATQEQVTMGSGKISVEMLRPQVKDILNLARQDADAYLYGMVTTDQIMKKIPASYIADFDEMISAESVVDEVVRHFPDFLPFREWLGVFLDGMRDKLDERLGRSDDEREEETAGTETSEAKPAEGAE